MSEVKSGCGRDCQGLTRLDYSQFNEIENRETNQLSSTLRTCYSGGQNVGPLDVIVTRQGNANPAAAAANKIYSCIAGADFTGAPNRVCTVCHVHCCDIHGPEHACVNIGQRRKKLSRPILPGEILSPPPLQLVVGREFSEEQEADVL